MVPWDRQRASRRNPEQIALVAREFQNTTIVGADSNISAHFDYSAVVFWVLE